MILSISHSKLIDHYGGSKGIRDTELIHSAIGRIKNGYYKDITEEAAALFQSLLIKHPFIDGNKRTAFGAMDVFLTINGWHIEGEIEHLYSAIIDLIETGADFFVIAEWVGKIAYPT